MIAIKHRYTGVPIFEAEAAESLVLCIQAAIKGGISLSYADLRYADLRHADLHFTSLDHADLRYATLRYADLHYADLSHADLRRADLSHAKLFKVRGLVQKMGVTTGNYYYKRFDSGLINNGYQFSVGRNNLRKGEIFASDPRVLCSHPGFHFASQAWCAHVYPYRPLEALIRIPIGATINEPWATDGEASADTIDIIQVWDTATRKDVTKKFKKEEKNDEGNNFEGRP